MNTKNTPSIKSILGYITHWALATVWNSCREKQCHKS